MITCRELVDFLMAYIDNELSPASRESFETHLRACPSCQRYLESYIQTVRMGKQAFAAGEEEGATGVRLRWWRRCVRRDVRGDDVI